MESQSEIGRGPQKEWSRRDVLRIGAYGLGAAALGAAVSPTLSGRAYGASGASSIKVAVVLPGPINDKSFNQVAYQALEACKKQLGVQTAYAENVAVSDLETILRDYAEHGFNLIFTHSFSYQDGTIAVAPSYPKTYFAVGTGLKRLANVSTYENPDYQGAYLAGILAAGASKKGVVGWVGTLPAPNLIRNYHAYRLGALAYNPKATALHDMIGSYYDPAKTEEAALAQFSAGAEVAYEESVGVVAAAQKAHKLAIGTIVDEHSEAPNNVLTSVEWSPTAVYLAITRTVIANKWASQNWVYGIRQKSIWLASMYGLASRVDPKARALEASTLKAIETGKFAVPKISTPI